MLRFIFPATNASKWPANNKCINYTYRILNFYVKWSRNQYPQDTWNKSSEHLKMLMATVNTGGNRRLQHTICWQCWQLSQGYVKLVAWFWSQNRFLCGRLISRYKIDRRSGYVNCTVKDDFTLPNHNAKTNCIVERMNDRRNIFKS